MSVMIVVGQIGCLIFNILLLSISHDCHSILLYAHIHGIVAAYLVNKIGLIQNVIPRRSCASSNQPELTLAGPGVSIRQITEDYWHDRINLTAEVFSNMDSQSGAYMYVITVLWKFVPWSACSLAGASCLSYLHHKSCIVI